MSSVLTYTPSDVVVLVEAYTLTDVVSINLTWNSETFQMVRGIRGQNTRRQNLDSSAILTVEVLQTSITNDVLSDLLIADRIAQSSRIYVSLKDNSGLTDISSLEAYVSTPPAVTYSNELTTRVWTIHMLNTVASVRGNAKPLPDLFGAAGDFLGNVADKITGVATDALDDLTNIL